MACFLAPAGVAIVTTVIQKVAKKKEGAAAHTEGESTSTPGKWTQRLRWLNTMLWGGVALLCLEHIWHGEVVPWPPFLTAMTTPGDVGPMVHEILTYGVAMAVMVLVAWGIMVAVAEIIERRANAADLPEVEPDHVGGGL
jgi:polyferredoxin